MPSSPIYQIEEVTELIILTKPESILDVGVGFGKYGFLAREYLELWDEREEYNNWQKKIDGIDAFKKYITPVHNFIYDNIYIGNALDILPTLKEKYDLILLIDILEHFDYEDGMKLLEKCKKCARNIIISTPKDIGIQNSIFGNPFEIHKFQWKKKHFKIFKNKFFIPNYYALICYIGEDAKKVKKYSIRSKVKDYFPFIRIPYIILKRIKNIFRS